MITPCTVSGIALESAPLHHGACEFLEEERVAVALLDKSRGDRFRQRPLAGDGLDELCAAAVSGRSAMCVSTIDRATGRDSRDDTS